MRRASLKLNVGNQTLALWPPFPYLQASIALRVTKLSATCTSVSHFHFFVDGMLTFVWFRYECTHEPSLWATFTLLIVRDCIDLLLSLVCLSIDFIDEAERLGNNWASWTIFTQARVFCIYALRSSTYLPSLSWQDVCWSLYVGKDFCIAEPVGAKATPMPHIFNEMPWFYPPAGIAPQPNNVTKTFQATCRLLMIARRIDMWVQNEAFTFLVLRHWPGILVVSKGLTKARHRPLISDAMIDNIEYAFFLTIDFVIDLRTSVQLNMWKSSLTNDVDITLGSLVGATPDKLMLHMTFWWLSILLHRPFLHRKSWSLHSMINHDKVSNISFNLVAGNLYKLSSLSYVVMLQTIFWSCYLPGAPSINSATAQPPLSIPRSLLVLCTFLRLYKLTPGLVLLQRNFDICWIRKRWWSNTFKK